MFALAAFLRANPLAVGLIASIAVICACIIAIDVRPQYIGPIFLIGFFGVLGTAGFTLSRVIDSESLPQQQSIRTISDPSTTSVATDSTEVLTVTQRRIFQVADGTVDLGNLHIRRSFRSGVCGPSRMDPDRAAARSCLVEQSVFDPCLPLPRGFLGGLSTFCYDEGPWKQPSTVPDSSAVPTYALERISKDLGSARGSGWQKPWALELLDGTRCLARSAFYVPFPAEALYECVKDDERVGWVVEYPDLSAPVWTVPFVRRNQADEGSRTVYVKVAWK